MRAERGWLSLAKIDATLVMFDSATACRIRWRLADIMADVTPRSCRELTKLH